jgi:fibronectin-binding autotransporter adhesin
VATWLTGGTVSATGTATVGNLATGGTVSATGTVTGGNVATAGTITATGTVTGGNLVTGGTVSSTGNVTGGNVLTGGAVSATGTGTFGNVNTAGTVSATGTVQGGNVLTAGEVSATGSLTGGNIFTGGVVSAVSTVTGGNVATAGTITATGTITGGNIATGGTVSATGTATVGNVFTGGVVSATGNVTGGNLLTSGSGGAISGSGNITGGNLFTGGTISAASNITGGNILFGSGIVSGTGNVYASNFIGNITGNIDAAGSNTEIQFNDNGLLGASAGLTFNTTGNVLTANGNISGANFLTAGVVSATGNITGNFFLGNGSQLTGIDATSIQNGNSNVQVYANSNVAVSIAGTSNVAVFTTTGISVTGNVQSTSYTLGANAVFGTSLTATTGATLAINATNSILMPVGNTAQRPTGVTGMVRFNTSTDKLEVYDSNSWEEVGATVFTVIGDDQFAGDGSTVTFTLSSSQTTDSCIVSINGVVQIPTTAYSVSGTTLTFTEAPQPGDDIDVRTITTTTTVTGISNSPGNASISVSDTSNVISVVGRLQGSGNALTIIGDLTITGNATVSGNVATNQINNGTSAVQIPSLNGNVNIDVGAVDNMTVFTSTGMFVTGNITATGDVTAQNVNSLSDATLKTNVTPIENAGAVVDALEGKGYDWKDGSGHSYGMIAQAVEEIIPEAVKTDATGIKSVNYQMVTPFLIETIKELRRDVAELKKLIQK